MNEKITQEIKYLAGAHTIGLMVGTGLQVQGHDMWLLSDTSGAFRITIPKKLFPWLRLGEVAIINLSCVQSFIDETQTPLIIQPGKAN